MQRPEPADAQDRTVTLSVQITGTQRRPGAKFGPVVRK